MFCMGCFLGYGSCETSKSIGAGVAICFAQSKVARHERKIWNLAPRYFWHCESDKNDFSPGSVEIFNAKARFDLA